MKRSVSLLCCALLLCGLLTGCNPPADDLSAPTEQTEAPTTQTVAIAYNREDTLDPFAAETQMNVYLSSLLYDSLVTLDENFMPQQAMGVIRQTDATHIAAQLAADLTFSDGSAVTLQDVVYSFRLAKASDNYKARLKGFSDAAVKGNTVVFTLSAPDMYAGACLNFPIIKRNTATDQAGAAPIGSGPYVYDPSAAVLTANPRAKDGNKATVPTVTLRHLVNDAAVLQALENGSIQYMFNDLSDGNIPRTSVKDTAINLTHLVYIGVNNHKTPTNAPLYRRAISAALDRTAIASAAYTGRALPATSPFHPAWKPAAGFSAMSAGTDTNASALLKQSLEAPVPTVATTKVTGNTTVTTTTTTTTTVAVGTSSATAAKRELVLIYSKGNSCREAAIKMIVSQLNAVGITVKAEALSYTDYMGRLQSGNYDLYLGEIRLTPNMDLSVFFRAGGSAAYGINTADDVVAKYNAFKDGSGTANAFVTAFGSDMPYIPLCWRQGMAAASPSVSHITPSAYNVYDGL